MIPILLTCAAALGPPQTPAPAVTPAPVVKADATRVAWFDKGLPVALAQANLQNRMSMVFFRAEWNGWCQRMNEESFASAEVAAALTDVVCVSVDYDKQRELADKYFVRDLPVVLWLNPDGSVRDRIAGYQAKDVLLANVARIKADTGTVNEARRKVAEKGEDLDLRFALYRRLREVGDFAGAQEQKTAITKLDPQGTSRGSHHFRFFEITAAIEQHWAQTKALDMQKVGELQTFVEAESDPELLWEGWMRLSNTWDYFANQAQSGGRLDDARAARVKRRAYLANAYRGIPQELFRDWAVTHGSQFWEQREELTAGDKEFLLTLTARLVEGFDKEGIAHDLRARALFLSGKNAEAVAESRKSLEIEPGNRVFQERLKQFGGS